MNKPCYKKSKELAAKLLADYEVDEPVVPVIELANRLGFRVMQYKPEGNLKDVSGFLDVDEQIIYVNERDSSARKSFTVAHELGHLLFEHQPNELGVLYRYASPIDKDSIEQEANCFAANLLVPDEMLEDVMEKFDLKEFDVQYLAKMFGVSEEVVKYRLKFRNGKA